MNINQYKVTKTPQGVYQLWRKQRDQRKWWLQCTPPTPDQIRDYEMSMLTDDQFAAAMLSSLQQE